MILRRIPVHRWVWRLLMPQGGGRRMLAGLGPAILCIALAAVVPAASLVAQTMRPPRGATDAFSPDIIRRDLDVLIESVGLTDSQRSVLLVLFSNYDEAFSAGRDAVRTKIAGLRPDEFSTNEAQERQQTLQRQSQEIMEAARREAEGSDDPDEQHRIMTEAQERLREIRQQIIDYGPAAATTPEVATMMRQMEVIIAQWEREKATILTEFFTDVRLILEDDQKDRWPIFERRLRRDRTLPRGRLSAENVDLHTIMIRFEPPDEIRRDVEAALLRYAVALDAALIGRNEQLAPLGILLREAEEEGDKDSLRQIAQRIALHHQNVRDVNLDHFDRIRGLLPPEMSATMSRVFEELAFPRTVRPTRTGRMIDAAERLDGLTEEQKVKLQEIVRNYRTGIARHNQELRAASIVGEPQALQQVLVQGTGSIVDAPMLRSARQARDEFEELIAERLRAVLTAEQLQRIPFAVTAPRERPQDWGEGRPGSEMTPEQRELFERFDRDGDGRLDASEREALRRYLEGSGTDS